MLAIAAVRKPEDQTSKDLDKLPKGSGSQLIVVKIDGDADSDATEAVHLLQRQHGIHALDLVIANAGISTCYPLVADARPDDMLRHYRVNVVAPMLLLQATRELLLASKTASGGKFVGMSSAAGWQTNMAALSPPPGANFGNAVYGPSKTALNYVLQKAHYEDKKLVIFPIDPGFVATEMGCKAATLFGMPGGMPPQTVDQSVSGMISVVSVPTMSRHAIQ